MTTFVGSAAGTNTATAPAHAAGDLMLVCATRNASATAPTLPAGFTNIGTITGTTNAMRVGYKICPTNAESVGTWTNATDVDVSIFRPTAGNIAEIGASKGTTGTVTPASYAGLTLVDQTGASWIACFGQAKGNATTIEGPPTGTTLRQDNIQTGELCSFDTNGAVSSWSTQTVAYTGTATTWKTFTVEILDIAPSAGIGNIIQRIALQANAQGSVNEPAENINFNLPNPSLSGNGLVVTVAYPSGATPSITDDKGNTWPASGAAGTVTADGGAGATAIQIFRLASAIAGTQNIKVSFGGAPQQPVKIWALELYNITGTVNGSVTGTNLNTSGLVSPGAFTPTNNNANGGNLVLAFAANDALFGSANPTRIWGSSGYRLLDADNSWTQGVGYPAASQALLQAASASTTPMFTFNGGTPDTYNVAAIALSVGVQGTPKPAGIHIDGITFFSTNSNPAIYSLQMPSTGNVGCLVSPSDDSAGGAKTASDSEAQAWTEKQTTTDMPQVFYRCGYSPSMGRSVFVTCSLTAGNVMWAYYDISGGDANSFDVYQGVGATNANNLNSISSQPSLTPGGQNEVIIGVTFNGFGPTLGITAPVGAVFDYPNYDTAQFTASMSGTRMTVTAVAWGTIQFNQSGAISGSGVAAGTALATVNTGTGTGGTGTYDITVSQTFASTTMKASSSDASTMNWGSSLAHYYNGSSTSAQSWTWSIASQPSNTIEGVAIAFKAAAVASALVAPLLSRGAPRMPINRLRSALVQGTIAAGGTSSVTADFGGLVEFLGSIRNDVAAPLEDLASARSDAAALLEYLASVRAESVAQIEAIAAVRRDGTGLPEFVEGLSAGIAAQLECLGSMRGDNLGATEMVAALRSDVIVLTEALSGRQSDIAAASEILAGLRADLVGPLENLGGVSVTADAAIPIELIAKVSFDRVAGLEAGTAARVDLGALAEIAAGMTRQAAAPVEVVLSLQGNIAAPIENLGGIAVLANAAVPIEAIGKIGVDQIAGIEVLAGLRSDAALVIETLASMVSSSPTSVEALASMASAGPASIEIVARFQSYMTVRFEFAGSNITVKVSPAVLLF